MIEWAYFPRTQRVPPLGKRVIDVFSDTAAKIDSESNNHLIGAEYKDAASDVVLSHLRAGLEAIGFRVEGGKKAAQKISVPVLFGRNGKAVRSFEADAYHEKEGFVIEVEAGRAVTNYQFLKDLFEAAVMVDVCYLAIAVRRIYKKAKDFETAHSFVDTLYSSDRLKLPPEGNSAHWILGAPRRDAAGLRRLLLIVSLGSSLLWILRMHCSRSRSI